MAKLIETTELMRPIAHFSHAARLDDVIHVGATAGTDAQRRLAGADPGRQDAAAQTRRMFDNLETALGLLGARMADVVQIKTYLADLRDIGAYRAIFAERFGAAAPSHAVVGSWLFPLPQAAVELDAIAVIGGASRVESLPELAPLPSGGPNGGLAAARQVFVAAAPLAPSGAIIRGDMIRQSAQVLANLARALRAHGLGMDALCRLHVTLADPRLLPEFDAAFRAVAAAPFPARTVVAAALEDADFLVQVEAVAAMDGFRAIGEEDPLLGPASPAVLVGETLYTSARTGLAPDGGFRDAQAQSEAAWDKVEATMAEAGIAPGNVLRTNNLLAHWHLFPGFNRAYGPRVEWPYPPRTTVLGQMAHPAMLAQVEAIAHARAGEASILQVPRGE